MSTEDSVIKKRSVVVIKVMQRDVPGIDHSFLAMDTEEGVEVVWNEVQFSERKSFKSQEVLMNFKPKILE